MGYPAAMWTIQDQVKRPNDDRVSLASGGRHRPWARGRTVAATSRGLAALAVAMLVAGLLSGFDVLRDGDGVSVKWPSRSIAVFVEAKPHGALTPRQLAKVTRAAMATWNEELTGGTRLVWGGLVAEDPRFDIFIRFDSAGFPERSQNPTGRLRMDADGGVLSRVRIELDAQHFTFSTSPTFSAKLNVDLQAVLTHQLGHALGLGFSRDRKAALYFFAVTAEQRELSEDDRRAVRWRYGDASAQPGRLCDACEGDDQCDGRCAQWPSGDSYCVRPCVGHQNCPVGFSCGTWAGGLACLPNDQHCAPDKAKVPVSGRCANDLACPKQLFCLATGDEAFCTAGCSSSCGTFGSCRQVQFGSQVVGLCMVAGNRGFGESCEVAPNCGSLVCTPSVLGGGRCSRGCASGCPQGAGCDADGKFCVKPGPLEVGWPCESGFDCASGLCVEHGAVFAKVCATKCTAAEDCPDGTGCTPTDSGMFCLPYGAPPPGAPCATPGACGTGNVCDTHPLPGVGRCAPTCDPYDAAATCPSGMRCAWRGASAPKPAGVCRPSGPGGLPGSTCEPTTPCRVDLVCVVGAEGEAAATQGTCQSVCDPSDSEACSAGATCRSLVGAGPQPAVCLTGTAAAAQLRTSAVGGDGQLSQNFSGQALLLADVKPYSPPTPQAPTDTGCSAGSRAGGHRSRAPATALLLLGCGVATLWRRRRLRRAE